MSYDPYPLFPVFSFLGFILSLIPLSWHLQAWNSGTCSYMIWVSLSCLVVFVNSVVWHGNVVNWAPVWCDISTKFLIGASVGIPASSLCISRRLYNISCVSTVSITRADKRRTVITDLCISAGLPVLVMALHYVVQGHRFDILEDLGCYPSIYNTLPAYFLVFMWPVVIGCVSFVYSVLTLHAFYKRRLQFNQIMASHRSLSPGRYIRLMLLAIIEMMCTIPVGICSVYLANVGVPLEPYISWENVHYGFSYVGFIPSIEWQSSPSFRASVEMTRWLFPACAFLFFVLFGFASEARKSYAMAYSNVLQLLGYEHWTPTTTIPECKKGGSRSVPPVSWTPSHSSAHGSPVGSTFKSSLDSYDLDLEESSDTAFPSPLLPAYDDGTPSIGGDVPRAI
ncbi:pheromone A receptor-domain-containing protein [Scleroderma citrinum]